MTVKELIKKLQECNQNAKLFVVVNNLTHDFTLSYSVDDGGDQKTCDEIHFYVDKLNSSENTS